MANSAASCSSVVDSGTIMIGDEYDSFEDACSICLEPFTSLDPPSVTKCKHEYHLQCIFEWSQRSNECPICSQHLILKDPASQELLAGMEINENSRSTPNFNNVVVDNGVNNDIVHVDEPDLEQRIMRNFATLANRARDMSRRKRQTPFPSQIVPSPPRDNSSNVTGTSSASHQAPERSNSAEFKAFSESLRSKFSTASTRYKETISKSTRGLKEKLMARNDSVKELSKGVHREMSAGFAKMIERLDIAQKRGSASDPPLSCKIRTSDPSFEESKC